MPARIRGYRELLEACAVADRATEREVRNALREAGEVVRREGKTRFSDVDERTASGYRTVVRLRGISVEQSLRRTTGRRPDFGALQMRKALIPALEENEDEVNKRMEEAVENIADLFELTARWRGSGLLP